MSTTTSHIVHRDAKLGKVTLFDAEGPRERGALGRIVLRVGNLQAALEQLKEENPEAYAKPEPSEDDEAEDGGGEEEEEE